MYVHSKRFDGSGAKASIVTMLWTGWQRNHGSNPGRDKRLLCLPECPDRFWATQQLLHKGSWGLFPGIKQLTTHLIQCQCQDCWALELYPPILLYGKHRHSFTFTVDVFFLFGMFQLDMLLLVVPNARLSKLVAHRYQWCCLLTFQ